MIIELPHKEPFLSCDMAVTGQIRSMKQSVHKAIYRAGIITKGEIVPSIDIWFNRTYCFDSLGRMTSVEIDFRDYIWMHYFDDSGRDDRFESREYDGTLKSLIEVEHDYKNKTSHYRVFDKDRQLTSQYIRYFDAKRNNTETRNFDKDMNPTETSYLKYDDNNQKIEDYRVKPDGSISFWNKSTYDDQGRTLTSTYLNPDSTINLEHRFEYDRLGKLYKHNDRYVAQKKQLDYKEVQHDSEGNWTVVIGFYRDKPALVVQRSFLYYNLKEHATIKTIIEKHISIPYIMTDLPEEKKIRHIHSQLTAIDDIPGNPDTEISPELINWVMEASNASDFSAIRYYAAKFKAIPTSVFYRNSNIEVMALFWELQKKLKAVPVHQYISESDSYPENIPSRYTLEFPGKPYLVQCIAIAAKRDTNYWYSAHIDNWEHDDGYIRTSPFYVFRPSDKSRKRDKAFEEVLQSIIAKCQLEINEDVPEISMIELQPDGRFKLSTYEVNDDFVIKNLDMHYGYGFEKFHNDLMERLRNETRGLVLFHGIPGTGKTYYIRHLLRKMTSYNKMVIYMPPNMVEWMVDPKFLNFLSKELARYSKQGIFCVLLIEDAEPLLAVRQEHGRVQGISNLLNMTDGILNDMLNIQIICTFNVRVKELDKALLRPGRMIARKEFRPMSMLDANRLAQQLGVNHTFTKPATLAEVYALEKNKGTLLHDDAEREPRE
jgi:hypothetical protein